MNKVTVAKVIIILFALVGLFLGGNLVHELNHRQDFKQIDKSNEYLCILGLEDLAYYRFSSNSEDKEEIKRISSYTEYKAYAIDSTLFILLTLSLIIVWRSKNGT